MSKYRRPWNLISNTISVLVLFLSFFQFFNLRQFFFLMDWLLLRVFYFLSNIRKSYFFLVGNLNSPDSTSYLNSSPPFNIQLNIYWEHKMNRNKLKYFSTTRFFFKNAKSKWEKIASEFDVIKFRTANLYCAYRVILFICFSMFFVPKFKWILIDEPHESSSRCFDGPM